jgi:hypothetical protein
MSNPYSRAYSSKTGVHSSFRKINFYSSSLYSKTLLTSRRVQFKQAKPIVKKEYLQIIWFHTVYVHVFYIDLQVTRIFYATGG